MSEGTKSIAISKLVTNIKPSATIAAAAMARQMKAEGIKVFDFSLGEPDFPTPDHICKAAFKAMQEGHTHYTPANGIPELRKAIAKMYQKLYGLECSADQIVVSNGAKHSLSNALTTVCGPGDEVIIPTPYWVSYSDLVEMTGARFVLVETKADSGFKMTPAQFRAAITPRTRLMMLNSPGNPSGTVYTRAEQEALADVALEAGVTVLSDEIYERLVYGDAKATCFATLRPKLAERTITISGVSKSYAMTGWRMGWAIAPLNVAKAMTSLQSQQTSNPSSISQYATLAAIEGDQDCVEQMRREFEVRRDLVCSRLNKIPGIRCPIPGGAFYAFFDVSSYFGKTLGGQKVTDSAAFCRAVLESGHICLVPGSAFGTEGYVRLSFATSREQLNGGIDRLEQWLKAG